MIQAQFIASRRVELQLAIVEVFGAQHGLLYHRRWTAYDESPYRLIIDRFNFQMGFKLIVEFIDDVFTGVARFLSNSLSIQSVNADSEYGRRIDA